MTNDELTIARENSIAYLEQYATPRLKINRMASITRVAWNIEMFSGVRIPESALYSACRALGISVIGKNPWPAFLCADFSSQLAPLPPRPDAREAAAGIQPPAPNAVADASSAGE